jgi:hypothetical protein
MREDQRLPGWHRPLRFASEVWLAARGQDTAHSRQRCCRRFPRRKGSLLDREAIKAERVDGTSH